MIKKCFLLAVVAFCFCCSIFTRGTVLADNETSFKTDVDYDIYYSVGKNESDVLRRVKILKTADMEGTKFLVVGNPGLSLGKKESYIAYNKISAIIASDGNNQPNRTFSQ